MAQNSSTKHLKLLKKIINLSVANSYMAFNPFSTYKVERESVEIDFLDEEELRKIINFNTPIPRFERAKDMFLFGCFTGLSYIDIKTLTAEHFEKGVKDRIWIKKRRVKTGVLSRIPLLPITKLILDKYKGGGGSSLNISKISFSEKFTPKVCTYKKCSLHLRNQLRI